MAETGITQDSLAPRLQFRLPPDPARLLRARERMRDYLQAHCSAHDLVDGVVLCIEEACTNAIRHSGSAEEMEVVLRFAGSDLFVEVTDAGSGFDTSTFDPEALPDLRAPGGRGLFLISKLMDELELRCDGGFRVNMVKRGVLRRGPQTLEAGLGEIAGHGPETHRETRLRILLEELDEAFFALDWQYRYVYANRAALHMMTKSTAELLGHTPTEVFPELGETPLMAAVRAAMELGRPSVLEQRSVVTGDWLELRVYPTPAGVSVYYHEINQRKHVEEELTASRERLATILDTISDAFYTLDRRWRVTFLSDKAATYFRRTKEELLGRDFWELFPETVGSAFEKSKRRAMEQRQGHLCRSL